MGLGKKKSIRNSPSIRQETGATMMEFAIVFPIFLLFVLGIFELSRYLYIKSLVTYWTDDALGLAQIIPGLDAEPGPNDPESVRQQILQIKTNAIRDVENAAAKLATNGVVSAVADTGSAYLKVPPRLILPTVGPNETMEEKLRTAPISVAMQVGVRPLLFNGIEFPINIRVSGYREIRKLTALPIPADCAGNLYGSPTYNLAACTTCPSVRMKVNGSTGDCECIDPVKLKMNATQTDCNCIDLNKNYAANTCSCRAPLVPVYSYNAGVTEPPCQCPTGLTQGVDSEGKTNCICVKTCSGAGMKLDSLACQCKCTTGPTISDDDGNLMCSACSLPAVWNGSVCMCPDNCPPGEAPTGPNCGCERPARDCTERCDPGQYCQPDVGCTACPGTCQYGFAYNCSCNYAPFSLSSSQSSYNPSSNGSDGNGGGENGDPGNPVNPGNPPPSSEPSNPVKGGIVDDDE